MQRAMGAVPGASRPPRAASPALARPHSRGPAALEQGAGALASLRCVAGVSVSVPRHHVAFRASAFPQGPHGEVRGWMQGKDGAHVQGVSGSFLAVPPAPGRKKLLGKPPAASCLRAWAGAAARLHSWFRTRRGWKEGCWGPGGAKRVLAHCTRGEGSPACPQPLPRLLL